MEISFTYLNSFTVELLIHKVHVSGHPPITMISVYCTAGYSVSISHCRIQSHLISQDSSTGLSLESSTSTLSLGFHWTLSCMHQHAGMLNLRSYTACIIKDQTLPCGRCILIALSRKVLELLNALLLTNVAPHWVPKSVTYII